MNKSWTAKQKSLNAAYLACFGWFPVAVLSAYLTIIEIQNRFFPLLYEASGLAGAPGLRDYLFLYKEDLLFNFAIIPSVIIITAYYLRDRRLLLKSVFLVVSLSLLFLLYANLHSWGTVGRSLTLTAAIDAATFAWQNPHFINMYVDVNSWLKISILAISVIFFYSLFDKLEKYTYIGISARYIVIGIISTALIGALIGYSSDMRAAPINGNFISQSISALTANNWEAGHNEYRGKDLVDEFRIITNARSVNESGDLQGTAAGNDLIVFIMETGSAHFIDLENDIKSFEVLNRLSKNSLIALNHHTTFPATSESLFSFFVSVYPPRSYYSTCVVSGEVQFKEPFPGIISSLKKSGYQSGLYLPFTDLVPLDHALHQNLGFDAVFFAQDNPKVKNMSRDAQALEEMKKDIMEWIKNDKAYAAVFLPQIGHAPWPKRPSHISVTAYGKKVAMMQDQWLGEIVQILEANDRLDKTTIVIVADHGIRTTKEDPNFRSGFVDEYSFHVPLLIYSKSSFPETLHIKELTSHIDVSPSLENILGVQENTEAVQGTLLWDRKIAERNTFFLGNWYFGADGYSEGSEYHSYNEILDLSFSSDKLTFTADDVNTDEGLKEEVKAKIRKLYDIQESWLKNFLCRHESQFSVGMAQ